MFLSEEISKKWSPVLDHPELAPIKDPYRKAVTAVILENQEKAFYEENNILREATTAGTGGFGGGANAGGPVAGFDPILISLVRRSLPNLIAYDICGVQPMTGPTGLIFAMRSRYAGQANTNDEAFFNEANTTHAGDYPNDSQVALSVAGTANTTNTFVQNAAAGSGLTTSQAESLGSSDAMKEMAFAIEKVTVTALTRALKAEYTMELAQDLKAVHGLDAEQELANILSTEILAEINREVVRQVNISATVGAQENVATAGTFDLDVDANGRWSVEKFKGLMFQLERESNAIAKATRRGKGNVMICSSDVASALQMAGVLDYTPALANNLQVDDTGNTFAGVLNGRIKVYIDPYFAASSGVHYATIGYKGTSAFDAGLFYCPYVPLQMVRAVGQDSFQPRIGFKTRYGMVANPFATSAGDGVIGFSNKNIYYRRFAITNLM
jgi:hypothetical protein